MTVQLKQFVERASDLAGSYGNYATAPANVDAETQAAPRCELIHQVLELFIHFCYQKDDNGIFSNLSGNSQIPQGIYVPWGSAGKPRRRGPSGRGRARLSYTERQAVRVWLRALRKNRGPQPVFHYSSPARRWFVDTQRYKTTDEALAWLQAHRLQPAAYVMIVNGLNARRNA